MGLKESVNAGVATVPSFWSGLGPVGFLVLIFFINFISRIILAPLLPTIEKELDISHAQAGSLFFFISAGYLLGLLGSGFIAARTTHRTTIVMSISGVGITLLCVALAGKFPTIGIGLLGLGLAAGLYIPSAVSTITALFDTRHWGKAIAVHELAPNMAFFFAPFLAELFLRWSSWRAALGALGLLAVITGIVFGRCGRGGDFSGQSPASSAFSLLLVTPSFWLMLVLFALGISSTIGVYSMLPLYLVSERHIDAGWANTVVALARSHGPFLGLLGGWVSDRLGIKRTLTISLVFTGVVSLLLGPAPNRWISWVVFFQPLLAVWFFPAGFAALAKIAPAPARNLAVAFAMPFGFLIGGGAIPTFIGVMGDRGSFAAGFLVTGILILSGGVLALLLRIPAAEERKD